MHEHPIHPHPTLPTRSSWTPTQTERLSFVIAVAVTALIAWIVPFEADRLTVTIENPTDHTLYISASTPDDPSSTFVMTAAPRSTTSMPGVLDRGASWVLHLRTLGAAAGRLDVSRSDLEGGSVVIPLSINEALAAAGVPIDVRDRGEEGTPGRTDGT